MEILKFEGKNFRMEVQPSGAVSLHSGKIDLPDLNWRFFKRPFVDLSELVPEKIEHSENGVCVTYKSSGLTVFSIVSIEGNSVDFSIEILNESGKDLDAMLFQLFSKESGFHGECITYTSGTCSFGRDIPGDIHIPVLEPQTGVLFNDRNEPVLIVSDLEGTEMFQIASEIPYTGSVIFGFPVEDEFSCGRRKIKNGSTYHSDRIRLEFPDEGCKCRDYFNSTRAEYLKLFPPRQSVKSREIKCYWNSWYAYGYTINEESVRRAIDFAAEHGLDAIEIDDGYFPEKADIPADCESIHFCVNKTKFPEGFAPLIRYGKKKGVDLLLWCRPLMVLPGDPLLKTHSDAFLKRPDGTPCNWIMGNILDPMHPFTAEFLKKFFAYTNGLGFAGYKIDFLGPLAEMRNEHIATGLVRPGDWAAQMWRIIAEAVGPDKLIHAATTMSVSPRLRQYIDIARCWGDNDPYYVRGSAGYSAFPFLRAFEYGTCWRSDPDMIYASKFWNRLCTSKFSMELFCDAFGSSFVSKALNWTENMEEFNSDLRAQVKVMLKYYGKLEFQPDRIMGHAVYTAENKDLFAVFARRAVKIAIPFAGTGYSFSPDGLHEIRGEKELVLKPYELVVLNRIKG